MKIAPLYHEMKKSSSFDPILVHTGQHYDFEMSDAFWRDLKLPSPDFSLGVGSGTHAEQTAAVMTAYERLCIQSPPDWTVVVGDVNSTMACALAAKKLLIPVAHLEAGLRSFDRTMPEEINRVVTDSVCDLLLTPSPECDENLRREGVPEKAIRRVGNIMIDSYEMLRGKIDSELAAEKLNLVKGQYAVVTLHRPSNVDSRKNLGALALRLGEISAMIKIVFPLHPRTKKNLEEFGMLEQIERNPAITLLKPLGYVEFMSLVVDSGLVITDSGGVQEETTYLGIPCITLRSNTERPVTVTAGTNRLSNPGLLLKDVGDAIGGGWPKGLRPELWDGKTAGRVAECLKEATALGAINFRKPAHV